MRFVLRARESRWLAPAAVGVAVLLTLVLTAGPIRLAGAAPVAAFERYVVTPLTTANGLAEVLLAATPLIFTGLAVAVAFRVGYYNIGVEGQFLAGAMATTAVALLDAGPARGRRAAGRAGRRRAGRGGVGVPARVPAPAVRHRRGGHHPAAQPRGGAAAAGAAERAVAQPRDRVPRLRALRRRATCCRRCSAPGCTPGCCSGWCWSPSPPSSCSRRRWACGCARPGSRRRRRSSPASRSGCCSGAARWSPGRWPGSAARRR